MEQKKKPSFFQHFLTLGVGTLIYVIIGALGTPIITRLVSPDEYGQMSLLTIYSTIGMTLCGLGLDQTLLRYFYRDDSLNYQRKLLWFCTGLPLIATAVLGSVLVAAFLLGLNWINRTELILLLISVVALLLQRIAMLVLRLRSHSKTYSTVNILQKASYIGISVGLIFVIRGHHFEILAVSTILSTLLAAVAAILFERDIWKLPERDLVFSVSKKELIQYGLPFIISNSVTVLFNALDKLFIEHYCTTADVGVYASAMNLVAIFAVVRTSFNAIWMPSAVEHYEKNPEDKTFYQRGNALISVLMLSLGAAVVLFKDLFVLLLGSEYQAASMILPYLMFEPIMYTISETTATGFVVQKKSTYQVIVSGVACLTNFLGNWLLTPVLGPQGAALSTGISYIVFFVLRTVLANRVFYVNYKLPKFAAAAAALMAFAVNGSNCSFSWVQIPMFLGVMAVILGAYWKECAAVAKSGKELLRRKIKKG